MALHEIRRVLVVATLALGCGAAGNDRGDAEGGGTETDESSSSSTSSDMTTTMTVTSVTVSTTMTDPTTDPDTGSTGDDPFVFEVGDPESYDQIDRQGMPGVTTMLITSTQEYGQATPEDDVGGDFVDEITTNLGALRDALADDLMGIGLTACSIDVCVTQVSALAVPDVLRIDLASDNGFPNGRRLEDPVMDTMLAVLLLDLGMHDTTALVEIPLNPTEGDVAPSSDFPFLAAPH